MLPPSSREFQGSRSCRVTYRSPIYRYHPTIGGSRLTPCSPGARWVSETSDKPISRAPVEQLLGAVIWPAGFGLRILVPCSIGGLFSPLPFYIDDHFTSSPHDSSQRISLDSPPSSVIVSAHSVFSSEDQPFGKCDLIIWPVISSVAFAALSPPMFVQTRNAASRSGATHANA